MAGSRQQAQFPESVDTVLKEKIRWKESVAVGAGTWVTGVVLSYLVLIIFNVTDRFEQSSVDLSIWIFLESFGSSMAEEELFTALAYGALDSNSFGAGIAIHALVPLVLVPIAGYVLAGRHLTGEETATATEAVIGAASLAVGFFAIAFLSGIVFSGDPVEIDLGSILLMGLLYPVVLGAAGGTLRTQTTVRSMGGFVGGFIAFFVGLVGWYLIEDPLESGSFSDLDGTFQHASFFVEYIATHGSAPDSLLPEWYVMIVFVAAGAGIAYQYETVDPLAGTGQGARLSVGYVVPVLLVVLLYVGSTIREINDQADGSWSEFAVVQANNVIGTAPLSIVLSGVIFPAVFGAIGGTIGAKLYESQQG